MLQSFGAPKIAYAVGRFALNNMKKTPKPTNGEPSLKWNGRRCFMIDEARPSHSQQVGVVEKISGRFEAVVQFDGKEKRRGYDDLLSAKAFVEIQIDDMWENRG